MPPKLNPSENYLLDKINMLEKQVTKLSQQQQTTISNSSGQAILNFGLLPALKSSQTTQQYGLQMLAPGGTTPIVQLGQQVDNTYGLDLFDANGNVLMKLTTAGLDLLNSSGSIVLALTDAGLTLNNSTGSALIALTDTGLQLNDSSGSALIQLTDTGLALLNSTGATIISLTTSGLELFDNNGNVLVTLNDTGLIVQQGTQNQHIVPIYSTSFMGSLSTSSTGWQNLGFPSIDVPIGSSGEAQIFMSGFASLTVLNSQAYAGLSIDGAAPTAVNLHLQLSNSIGGSSCASAFIVSGLSQATHTFSIWYQAGTSGDAISFDTNALIVWPL